MGSKNSKLLVLAIEVGNKKSGFAFSEKNNKSSKIHTATDDTYLKIDRMPTALLLKEDLSLDNFGFYAEEKYMSLSLKNEHSNYMYFNNLEIYQSDDTFYIKDCSGNKLEAVRIYLTIINHLLGMCVRQAKLYTKFENLEKNLIVTVPDNVSKEIKEYLKSQIKDVKNVRFVSTSEASAAYCISQKFILNEETKTEKMQTDTSFIVVNFGRRLTTVCLQRVTSSDNCKLLRKSEVKTGGDYITDLWLEDIKNRYEFGENWKKIISNFYDFEKLLRDFNDEKHKFNETTECVFIEMPISVMHLMEENDHLYKHTDIRKNKLIISKESMEDYFQRSLKDLISTIQEMGKNKDESIDFILLLGGYSKSSIVRKIIKEGVSPKHVILVSEPEMGVLKGAVMLGFQDNDMGTCNFRFF
jgi:hypothetical protein